MRMPVTFLSCIQKSQVCFANIAIVQPNILVLDEFTNFLNKDGVYILSKSFVKI